VNTDHDHDAAQRAAEQAWDSSPELRRYFQGDRAAFVAQALQNARISTTPADQPELRA